MKVRLIGLLSAIAFVIGLGGAHLIGQAGADTPQKHLDAAKAAAGQDYAWMYNTLCVEALGNLGKPPARSTWHAEPVKVFDNMYRVGTIEHSAWAITTSDGIILMDAIFDYNVQDEVIEGLKKLGLNPATIKYAIISHGHGDHVGGASALQELFGTHIILGKEDWDLLERTGPGASSAAGMPLPQRDMIGTDGMNVTLGDTTVTMYTTPGHTQGTLSSIIPVKDGGKPHVVAYWGGTMFNWVANRAQYITPKTGDKYWFDIYAKSADRFKDIAAKAGADVVMSNHTNFDNTKMKEPLMPLRKPGDAFHPYVVGKDSVQRYLTTVSECAKAGSLLSK
jgi:metallo-beta-lactamase class B